jgi:glycerophosphoryl diester phosphodiesterase
MNTVKFNKGNTLIIAHRGLSGIERENTCSAFVAAGNRSYYGIETDIHKTADGKFVVCHDFDLSRVSGEKISVESVSLATLTSIILYDKDGSKDRADLRPCTLENYIGICKRYEKHSVLELKSDFTDEEIAKIVDIIKELGHLENTTFISFEYENLVKIRAILPEQSVQYLFTNATPDKIELALSAKMDVDVGHGSLNEENIKLLHDAGVKINCWTVDNPERAEQLAKMGVDFITTNILE